MNVRPLFKSFLAASGFAAALAASALSFGANPTTYSANTTLNYYNNATLGVDYPTLPAWGGATGAINTKINDPTFGTPIIRVTNANTSILTRGCASPDSSEARNWNTNSTLFYVHDTGGGRTIGFNFNTTTLVATQITDTLPAFDDFDATNSQHCYCHTGTKFQYYDFTPATKGTHDFIDIQSITSYNLHGRISGDLRTSRNGVSGIITGGPAQNTDFLCICYNAVTGVYFILDTTEANGIIVGGIMQKGTIRDSSGALVGTFNAGTSCATKFHNCTIAPGGRYLMLAAGDGTSTVGIWDTQTQTVYPMTVQTGGHRVFGYGIGGNSALINEGTNAAHNNATWLIRGVAAAQIGTAADLVEHPATDPNRWDHTHASYDNHDSWNNSRSNASQPFFSSNYHIAGDTADPGLVWGDEIIAVGTSSASNNNTVYRFCQHRSKQNTYSDGVYFYDTPRGNISQDGLFFMFTSNYNDTLGTDPNSSKFRTDVFVLKLTAGS